MDDINEAEFFQESLDKTNIENLMAEKGGENSESPNNNSEAINLQIQQNEIRKLANNLHFSEKFNSYKDIEMAEISTIIPDAIQNDPRNCYSKYVPLTSDHVQPEDLQIEGNRAEMIRILPTPLPILDEEIKWVMPFSVDDIIWDHTNFDLKTTVN